MTLMMNLSFEILSSRFYGLYKYYINNKSTSSGINSVLNLEKRSILSMSKFLNVSSSVLSLTADGFVIKTYGKAERK
jgi:hypothetical protein